MLRDHLITSQQNLEAVQRMTTGLGLQSVDLPPATVGVGFGISWGETDYVVVSVPGQPNDSQAFLTCGVLRDIRQDRLAALEECNRQVTENPAYPFFLHAADAGWDILLQQSYPLQLLLDVPPFYQACLQGMIGATQDARPAFAERGLGGVPYRWDSEDSERLVKRSVM